MTDLPTADDPAKVIVGDSLAVLRTLPDGCGHCCVTSPPYWSLRQYIPPGSMRLKAGLSREKVEWILAELKRAGVSPDNPG